MKVVSVHLPDEYLEALRYLASSGAVSSIGEAIRLAVRDYITEEYRLLSKLDSSPDGEDGRRAQPSGGYSYDRLIELMKKAGYSQIYVHRARGGVPPNILAMKINGDGRPEIHAVMLSSRFREPSEEEMRHFVEYARQIGAKPLIALYRREPRRRGPRRIVLQDIGQGDVCV